MVYQICSICSDSNHLTLFFFNKFRFVKCFKCSFVYIAPSPTNKELGEYYKKFNYKIGFINEEIIRSDAKRTLREISSFKKKGKLLDVGCGAGFFLDEARKYQWITEGVDVSVEAVMFGQNNLNLPIKLGDFLTTDFQKENFDLISLNQVIEHLVDPEKILKKIYYLLKPSGIICVATPNIDSIMSKILKENFNYIIPPEHTLYFSPSTLKLILKNNNFKILKVRSWSYPSDLAGIIKYLLKGKKEMRQREKNQNKIKNRHFKSNFKIVKSIIFDQIICKIFYRFLNINNQGSMIEIYAQKI